MQRLLERKVDGRLACLLLELAERFGEDGGRGTGVRIRLSYHDLSRMVACTREAVSKAMRGFREAGLIETRRPCRVVVLDELRLSEVAMGGAVTVPDRFTGDTSGFPSTGVLASSKKGSFVVRLDGVCRSRSIPVQGC